jgi:hypothetical protein
LANVGIGHIAFSDSWAPGHWFVAIEQSQLSCRIPDR